MKVLFAQLCPKLCDHMDCSLPGSSIHGILQIRILEWIDILFSRGSSWPRDCTRVSYIAGRLFIIWATIWDRSSAIHSSFCLKFFNDIHQLFFFFFLCRIPLNLNLSDDSLLLVSGYKFLSGNLLKWYFTILSESYWCTWFRLH